MWYMETHILCLSKKTYLLFIRKSEKFWVLPRLAGGSGEASPGAEVCAVQPRVHLWAHGGGGVLPDDLERERVRLWAAHLPLGADWDGCLRHHRGSDVLLLTQVEQWLLFLV